MSLFALSVGSEGTSALAAARSSRHCSTSGRPFEFQRTASLDRRDESLATSLATASRKASRGRYYRANFSSLLLGRAVSWWARQTYGIFCSKLSCHATTLTQQPLSTYRWPRRRPSVLEWLDSCVQDAVRQLDHAPFVQLVYSESAHLLETHQVPRTATGSSEVSFILSCAGQLSLCCLSSVELRESI